MWWRRARIGMDPSLPSTRFWSIVPTERRSEIAGHHAIVQILHDLKITQLQPSERRTSRGHGLLREWQCARLPASSPRSFDLSREAATPAADDLSPARPYPGPRGVDVPAARAARDIRPRPEVITPGDGDSEKRCGNLRLASIRAAGSLLLEEGLQLT